MAQIAKRIAPQDDWTKKPFVNYMLTLDSVATESFMSKELVY
jgi:hypothetical protein